MKKIASISLILVFVLPLLATPLSSLVAQAVVSGREIRTDPTPIALVRGQDAVVVVTSDRGAFGANRELFYQLADPEAPVSMENWYSFVNALDTGFNWKRQKADSTGTINRVPLFLSSSETDLLEGEYELRITDEGSTGPGYLSTPVRVFEGLSTPTLFFPDYGFYTASSVVDTLTQNLDFDTIAKVRVGQSLTVTVFGFPETATQARVYWDSTANLLGTISLAGGAGAGSFEVPKASMGVHAVIAFAQAEVDGETYYFVAANFVYVVPSITVDPFIIAGREGERFTIKGEGFPAGFHLDPDNSYINNEFGTGAPYAISLSTTLIRDDGSITVRATLQGSLFEEDRGLLNVNIPIREAEFPGWLQVFFSFKQVMVASSPRIPGDEGLFMLGRDPTVGTVTAFTGTPFKIAVYNFPANTRVSVYIGAWEVASLRTNALGAVVSTIQVPVIPYGQYLVKVVDERSGLVAYKASPNPAFENWVINVIPLKPAWTWDLSAERDQLVFKSPITGQRFLDPGVTVSIFVTGLKPFEPVTIWETDGAVNYTEETVYADENGVATFEFQTTDKIRNVGVEVQVHVSSGTIANTWGDTLAFTYYTPGPSTLMFPGGSDYPVPWVSNLTFNLVDLELTNLVPGLKYKVYIDGREAQVRTPDLRTVRVIVANSLTEVKDFKVRVPVSSYGIHTLELRDLATGKVRAIGFLIISNPTAGTRVGVELLYPTQLPSGPAFTEEPILLAGWNFAVGEALEVMLAGYQGTIFVDENGAFLELLGDVLGEVTLPRGTYALAISREQLNYTQVNPILVEIVPTIYSPGAKIKRAVGDLISVEAYGLDSSRYYAVFWGTETSLGSLIGLEQSDIMGRFTTAVSTPAGLVGNTYYLRVTALDDPTDVVIEIAVVIKPKAGLGWTTGLSSTVLIPGQLLTLEVRGFTNFASAIDLPLPLDMNLLMVKGKGFIILSTPDGSVTRLLEGYLHYIPAKDVMHITAPVPNDFAELADTLFTVSVQIVYQDETGAVQTSSVMPIGGVLRVASGGLLTGLGVGVQEDIAFIKTKLGTIEMKLDDLGMVITSINDTVAMIDTSIGTVLASLDTLMSLIDNSTMTLVEKGDELMAAIQSANTTIHAKLDAILELIGGGAQVNLSAVEQGIVQIITQLGVITTQLSDMQELLSAVGDQVLLMVDTVGGLNDTVSGLANIVVMKGDEIIATLSASLQELDAKVVDVRDGVATLDTKLGEMQMTLSDGQAQITGLVEKNGQLLVQINDAITASASQLRDLIENGVRVDISNLASATQSNFNKVLNEVANANSALADVNTKVSAIQGDLSDLSGRVTAVQSDLADTKTTLSGVKATVDTLPSKIDEVSGKVDQLSSKLDTVQDNVVSSVDSAKSRATVFGAINLILILIVAALVYVFSRRT